MDNNRPLLSICIPSFNRVDVLQQCLDSILKVCNSNDIEVVVSDNCSTDGTRDLCEQYQRKFSQLKYYVNEENIGADANILRSLELGSGMFLKLNNDYSIYKEGSLEYLLNVVKKYSREKPVLFFNQGAVCECEEQFSTIDDIVLREGWGMSWIGCYGYWKDDFDSWQNRDARQDTMFQQVDWFIRSYKKKRKIVYVQKRLTDRKETISKQGGYDFIRVHTTNYFVQFEELVNEKLLKKTSLINLKKRVLSCMLSWITKLKEDNGNKYSYEYNSPLIHLFTEYKMYPWFYIAIAKFEIKNILKSIKNR